MPAAVVLAILLWTSIVQAEKRVSLVIGNSASKLFNLGNNAKAIAGMLQARARVGKEAYELDIQQQCCGGLNFGYFYKDPPIIAYDDEPQPAYTMHDFTQSAVPGCRTPHLWLTDRRWLYDALGPDYTLRCFDPAVDVMGVAEVAPRRGVPLSILDLEESSARPPYHHKVVLVRPDQHVAWCGDEASADPMELIDLVRGARTASVSRPPPWLPSMHNSKERRAAFISPSTSQRRGAS